MSETGKAKTPTWDDIAWTYCGAALSVIWYVLHGSNNPIYLFWAIAFFIHATAQRIIREVRNLRTVAN